MAIDYVGGQVAGRTNPTNALQVTFSLTVSPSASPSPSPGWQDYTRGNDVGLPGNDADLETTYSAGDLTTVSTNDTNRVAQTGFQEYMIHQFKDFAGSNISCTLNWDGQSTLVPSVSTVYLQIYNRDTTTWDEVDRDDASGADTDFPLTGVVANLNPYKDASDVISCRVWQQAT